MRPDHSFVRVELSLMSVEEVAGAETRAKEESAVTVTLGSSAGNVDSNEHDDDSDRDDGNQAAPKRVATVVASKLCKRYGQLTALNQVSFTIRAGQRVALLGPNGAGKTTLLRTLVGFIAPESGTLSVAGVDAIKRPTVAASHVGFLPEGAPAYRDMAVRAYLRMRAALKGLDRNRHLRVDALLDRVGLADRARSQIGALSRGMRQRLGLADALLADPPLLVLDEPTSGLDPAQLRELTSIISELSSDRALVFSSHRLDAVASLCDRALVMARGAIVFDGSLDELAGTAVPADLEAAFLTLTEDSR